MCVALAFSVYEIEEAHEHFARRVLSGMEAKFGDVKKENPMITIKNLQQEGFISEYEEKFDELLLEVDLVEEVVMNLYVGGLRKDIQKSVVNFKPSSLANAMCMARMQEATIQAIHEHAPMSSQSIRKNSPSAFLSSPNDSVYKALSTYLGPKLSPTSHKANVTSGVSLTRASKPMKQLSKMEMDEVTERALLLVLREIFQ